MIIIVVYCGFFQYLFYQLKENPGCGSHIIIESPLHFINFLFQEYVDSLFYVLIFMFITDI